MLADFLILLLVGKLFCRCKSLWSWRKQLLSHAWSSSREFRMLCIFFLFVTIRLSTSFLNCQISGPRIKKLLSVSIWTCYLLSEQFLSEHNTSYSDFAILDNGFRSFSS